MRRKALKFDDVLKSGIFHCTSLESLERILEAGAIVPNRGQFPVNHGLSKQSKTWNMGGIALFDQAVCSRRSWFLQWQRQTGLAIVLDRRSVPPLIDLHFQKSIKGICLDGEVCCVEPVPASCFLGYLVGIDPDLKLLSAEATPTQIRSELATLRKASK